MRDDICKFLVNSAKGCNLEQHASFIQWIENLEHQEVISKDEFNFAKESSFIQMRPI